VKVPLSVERSNKLTIITRDFFDEKRFVGAVASR